MVAIEAVFREKHKDSGILEYQVDLDSVHKMDRSDRPVYKLAKVHTQERNLFELLVQVVFINNEFSEQIKSKPFLIKTKRMNDELVELREGEKENTVTTSKENKSQVQTFGIVDYKGGVVVAEDVQLTCPTGAVGQSEDPVPIKITLEKPSTHCDMIVKNGLQNDVMLIAPVINLQPNGQVFKKPITLTTTLTIDEHSSRNDVLVLHGTQTTDGRIVWEDFTHKSKIDLENEKLEVEINHFSRIAVLLKLTSILAKDILTRLNISGFHYTLSVLFKDNHPHTPFGELALVFMSHDVYHEKCYREHPSSVLMQLKGNGFEEMCSIDRPESNRIYNGENLKVSLLLGRDYKLTDGHLERTDCIVESAIWWNTGHVIQMSLKGSDGARILCGKIGVEGQHGHILENTFCELDRCRYVRQLLKVEGTILNLLPVAQKLEVPQEEINEVIKLWQKDEEQLKIILKGWSNGQDDCDMDDPAMLRNNLQELSPEDYEVDERGEMHINHLRELAFEIRGLHRDDPHLMEYFANQIRTLCDFILKDCCIEMNAEVSIESYPRFLSFHQRVTEDVAKKLENICASSTRSIIEDFFFVLPFLIQAIKEIFRKEKPSVVQNGLKGLPKEIVSLYECNVRDAFQNKDIFKLMYEVCSVLERLCLSNCSKQSTEEIDVWSKSLGIWNMADCLKSFFQGRQDSKLHKRLQLLSCSISRIAADIRSVKEIDLRYFYNVSLNLIKFATFDPSKLVRFEITNPTNCPMTCYSEALKYDGPHDTFSQQFEVRKESEDDLQLEAVARVHLDGQIREVGAFQSVIMLPPSSEEQFDSCSIGSLPVAIKRERTDSGNLRVVLYSTSRRNISEALSVLQRELGDDTVDGAQAEVTESRLTVRCYAEAGKVASLRLLYKWQSEAISVESKGFVAIANSSDGGASTSDLQMTGLNTPLEDELSALSIANSPTAENRNFGMDPSALVETLQTHNQTQCGPVEVHYPMRHTHRKGHVCVTAENTSLNMEVPYTAQRLPQAETSVPFQNIIAEGPSSSALTASEQDELMDKSFDTERTESLEDVSGHKQPFGSQREVHDYDLPPVSPAKVARIGTILKEDTVINEDLERLSQSVGNVWVRLGRRLDIDQATLEAIQIDPRWPYLAEKAFQMLLCWRNKNGSDATYRVLYVALCHEFVSRRDLAEKICFQNVS
ncbi:uncharacterized protein LOC144638728 isoform X1 [Oculina patagonica]